MVIQKMERDGKENRVANTRALGTLEGRLQQGIEKLDSIRKAGIFDFQSIRQYAACFMATKSDTTKDMA